MHQGLTEVFASHTYVGLVDSYRRIAAIQGGVKLYLVDYGMISNEYFYQLGLTDFGNFGAIKLNPPMNIRSLINIGIRYEKSLERPEDKDIAWDEVAEAVTSQLIRRRAMLIEYFNFEVSEEGELLCLPLLMVGYAPSLNKLPRLLMRLGPYVDWMDEQNCFHTFLRELAAFYTPEQLPPFRKDPGGSTELGEATQIAEINFEAQRSEMERALEHILFPAFKARLVATKGLLKGVHEVANLKGLYRVFERC